jgi:hypothetical protein
MSIFYFNVMDGRNTEFMDDGIELPDKDAAWIEATSASGELLRNLDGRLRPGDHWSMHVKDESGSEIYVLEFKTKAI